MDWHTIVIEVVSKLLVPHHLFGIKLVLSAFLGLGNGWGVGRAQHGSGGLFFFFCLFFTIKENTISSHALLLR